MNSSSDHQPNDDFDAAADQPHRDRKPAEGDSKTADSNGGRGNNGQAADDHATAADAVLEENHAPPQLETRDEAMQRMAEEVEQARQRVLIAQAELENFRKRTRKDYEDKLKYASLGLVEELLPVRDNLLRAIEAAQQSGGGESVADGLRAGVEIVLKQFDDALGKHGVQPIAAVGAEFDPNVHQAISQMPSDQHDAGTVVHEAIGGFTLYDRVVRPSQVIVSSGSGDSNNAG